MKLVYYPDPALTSKCEPITEFNEELHKTLDEMRTVMVQSNGIGLAANQVAILKTMFIMQDRKGKIWDFINPVIVSEDGVQYEQEGCLSFPGVYLQIARAASIVVKAQDRNGQEFQVVAEGIESVCILHEWEHIHSIIFIDKVSRQQRRAAEAILKRRPK